MQPAFLIPLEKFPTTSSGERDRKAISALPLPQHDINNKNIVLTSLERALKTVWEDVLPNDLANLRGITPETDFFHIGGSSLLLLPLREKIRTTFGIELQLLDMFKASVLSSMAHRIKGRIDAKEPIDWDQEISLLPSVVDNGMELLQRILRSESMVVILTGGSSYLGKGLIRAMLRNPLMGEIHCLGVRNATSRSDLQGLPKVMLYEGDLCQPCIGLTHSVISHLFNRADLIIHSGTDISYMKTCQSLRQSNFMTTKDLVEWGLPRMIPFHFISTAGVGKLAPESSLREASVASTPPPTDGNVAYTACKWASERFLEKLVEKYPQWPVCIHRPTLISRDDIPQLDVAHNILGYARKLKAIPKSIVLARGVLNAVGLDAVVEGVLNCALRQDAEDDQGGVHYLNHVGKLNLPLGDMKKWALEKTTDGYVDFSDVDLEEIPMEEWIRRASESGMHPAMARYFLVSHVEGRLNSRWCSRYDPRSLQCSFTSYSCCIGV